jgi:ABC-2 type transport system permease protein
MTALLVCEVRRLLRSPRFLIFTAGLPLVYFLLFSGIYAPDGGETVVVLMAMMAAFGAISASISVGGRVANERHIGWNRQLRLTPLPGWGYLAVKAATAMLVVLPALLLVFGVAAVVKGVELGVGTWIAVLLTAWLSVLPAALASAAQFLPSYWIVAETLGQMSGAGLDVVGVLVLLAWLVAVGALVIVRYRRDALRV